MSQVFIIAEAGVNHNGSLETAKKMIDVASEAGADAIKFQTFVAEKMISRHAQKADYQKETTDKNESQLDMVKKYQLGKKEHEELIAHCIKRDIKFMSTPFDSDSIELLNELGLDTFKIPSGEITNLPYLRNIGRLGKKIILSSGMSELKEIIAAINILMQAGTKTTEITVLQCNTEYPTPFEDVNLLAMKTIEKACMVDVGYSDHTLGVEVPVAAVAMGAKVIEKHFTLDRNMDGPDHKASMEPKELNRMVEAIRNAETAFGNATKLPTPSEKKNRIITRKSIVAAKAIKKGDFFTEDNLTTKRPGNGITPMKWDEVVGKEAKRDFKEDEAIEL